MDLEKNSFELALTATGDRFTPSEHATDFRVKELKARGAPGTKYFQDGRVMTVPINATLDELRDIVGQAGRYRLDQVDGDGKLIEGAQSAYIVLGQLGKSEPAPEPARGRDEGTTSNDLMRDILQLNAELARQVARPVTTTTDALLLDVVRMNTSMANAVIERFATMMDSGAGVIAAADGAGMPAREPREFEADDGESDDAAKRGPTPAQPSTLTIIAPMVTEIVTNVVDKLMNRSAPAASARASTTSVAPVAPAVVPAPVTVAAPASAAAPAAAGSTATSAPTPDTPKTAQALPPLDPMTMVKMYAIQSQLTKEEADLAKALGAELSPSELHAWAAELTALPVPDAVAKIRSVISAPTANAATAGGAS